MALNVGSRLGHYDVTALIGEGGMGQVYRMLRRGILVLVLGILLSGCGVPEPEAESSHSLRALGTVTTSVAEGVLSG